MLEKAAHVLEQAEYTFRASRIVTWLAGRTPNQRCVLLTPCLLRFAAYESYEASVNFLTTLISAPIAVKSLKIFACKARKPKPDL